MSSAMAEKAHVCDVEFECKNFGDICRKGNAI
jgi:hypothetical protein